MDDETRLTVPEPAPDWEELYERAPYENVDRDDPVGGVVVHRCHPSIFPEDLLAFAYRHETMKGYVEKDAKLYDGTSWKKVGISRWDGAVNSFHVRAGSHEECTVCHGTADPNDILREVVGKATDQVGGEHNVAHSGVYGKQRDGSHRATVYLDSHGMSSTNGPYSVPNSTQHWDDVIEKHPYVQMVGAEEVAEGGNWASPDNTLRVVLKTWYPDVMPEAQPF